MVSIDVIVQCTKRYKMKKSNKNKRNNCFRLKLMSLKDEIDFFFFVRLVCGF